MKPRSRMITNNNEESGVELNNNDSEATLTDYDSDSKSNTLSNDSSDNDASDEEIDEFELQKLQYKISYPDCGLFVSSECHLKSHQGSNACKEANFNNTVEARAIRTLWNKLDNNSMRILTKQSDVSRASPISDHSNLDHARKCFTCG